MKERNHQIDNIRAIAIIIVVFGHSIILYSSTWNLYASNYNVPVLDYIKSWINLIQMPLFFSLSGQLFLFEIDRHKLLSIIKRKTIRLLIPYLTIAAIWMIPIKLLVGYPGYKGKNFFNIYFHDILLGHDNGHLWYLPCLYLCFIIAKIIFDLIKSNYVTIIALTISIFLVLGSRLFGGGYLGIQLITLYTS